MITFLGCLIAMEVFNRKQSSSGVLIYSLLPLVKIPLPFCFPLIKITDNNIRPKTQPSIDEILPAPMNSSTAEAPSMWPQAPTEEAVLPPSTDEEPQEESQPGGLETPEVQLVSVDYRAGQSQADLTITTPLISALTGGSTTTPEPPPKPARSAYKMFVELERERLIDETTEDGNNRAIDVPLELCKRWSSIQSWQRETYRKLAYIDQYRYNEEYREWRAKHSFDYNSDPFEPTPIREEEKWPFRETRAAAAAAATASRPIPSTSTTHGTHQALQPTVKHLLEQTGETYRSKRSRKAPSGDQMGGFLDQGGV